MALNLREKREFEIELDKRHTVRELTGKNVCKFERLLNFTSEHKDDKTKEEEVAQAYYDLVKIILPEVSDVWIDKELTADRLMALIALQHKANTREDLKKNLVLFLNQDQAEE